MQLNKHTGERPMEPRGKVHHPFLFRRPNSGLQSVGCGLESGLWSGVVVCGVVWVGLAVIRVWSVVWCVVCCVVCNVVWGVV